MFFWNYLKKTLLKFTDIVNSDNCIGKNTSNETLSEFWYLKKNCFQNGLIVLGLRDAPATEHTVKYFLNLVNLHQIWIVITPFRFDWHQMGVFPRERPALPLPQKVINLDFWFKKMRKVLVKQFYGFLFNFFYQNFLFMFQGPKRYFDKYSVDEKKNSLRFW